MPNLIQRFLMLIEEREWLFHAELIKAGVDFQRAAQTAKILAMRKPDEQLTPEEQQLVKSACAQWLAQRKRMRFISQVLNKLPNEPTQPGFPNSLLKPKWDNIPFKDSRNF